MQAHQTMVIIADVRSVLFEMDKRINYFKILTLQFSKKQKGCSVFIFYPWLTLQETCSVTLLIFVDLSAQWSWSWGCKCTPKSFDLSKFGQIPKNPGPEV